MAHFPFSDLHSFKDYVGFVKICAPDLFPDREGVGPDEKWTLELAFRGLRLGLDMAIQEKGDRPQFGTSRELVEEAYEDYRAGRMRDGFMKLEEVQKLLRKIRSQ